MISDVKPRRRHVAPRDPNAEQVCLLDKEAASRRSPSVEGRGEPPDAFLDAARSQETREAGATFRFAAEPGMWERMSAFVDEEGDCCPFFAFEQSEEGDELVLRIITPPAGAGRPPADSGGPPAGDGRPSQGNE